MMKFDNGTPFGDPNKHFVPPMALWLTGLGVEVVWNRSRTPQDNAKVERMQGLTAKWSEARKCDGIETLAVRLEEACRFQREEYPTRTCKGSTRIKAFPQLGRILKPFAEVEFDIDKVKQFIAKGIWERKVSSTGQVYLASKRLYLGKKHNGQNTYAQYIHESHEWVFSDKHGQIIRTFPADFNSESIQDLSAFAPPKLS